MWWSVWGSCLHLDVSFRGTREHEGVDIKCRDGEDVYAPFDVTLVRPVIVYGDPAKAAIDRGIELRGEGGFMVLTLYWCHWWWIHWRCDLLTPAGLCFKLFYVDPDRTSETVEKGNKLGTMMPMQSVYPGITSHIHVQMCDKSDPSPYLWSSPDLPDLL